MGEPYTGELFRPSIGSKPLSSTFYIGTSGFSFRDWRGTFYPLSLASNEHLPYYAQHFDVVEINATYYEIPGRRTFESMVQRTPDRFGFWVKLPGVATHTRDDPRPTMERWNEALAPLKEASRMRGGLAQMPPSFRPSEEARSRLLLLKELAKVPLAVEFRHRSWQNDDTYHWLEESGFILVAVDAPPLPYLPSPQGVTTGGMGYVRFHGRNIAAWSGVSRGDRYNYEYSQEELLEWLPRLKAISQSAEVTYIFFNNCHAGQAVRSAMMMRELIAEEFNGGKSG
ncbi:MAG: DUF72 domain-containing protein [bacterium]